MADATIEVLKDGPLKVTGITQRRNSRGETLEVQETIFLCRCGGSQKKPYCDGTHKRNGFQDEKN